MNYKYIGYTRDNTIVKGKIVAPSGEAAAEMLLNAGYHVLNLKESTPFFSLGKISDYFATVDKRDVVMFSRQLSLLLESGTDIITCLELLQSQVSNRTLKRILGEVVGDIRSGSTFSDALSKHPKAFPPIYHRLVSVGEHSGNLEVVLRRAADHIEREAETRQSVKGALVYPAILAVLAIIVVGIMVSFVLPTFTRLYESFDVELPAITQALISISDWTLHYGLVVLIIIAGIIAAGYIYSRTPTGRYQWGKISLTAPLLGHINLLNELSRCSRTIALLFSSGLALPEIMTLIIQSTKNRAMELAYIDVQQYMIAGGGLSGPMSQNKLFLPLMVQMTAVGEQTGSLDKTLTTVAESFETESDYKTKSLVAMITPATTVIMGLVIGFIAVALLSSMYSIFGQVSF